MRKIEKVVVVSGSRWMQKTELQDLQLGVVMNIQALHYVIGVVAASKACTAGYNALYNSCTGTS